jgi:hypothetical protein
MDNNDTEQPTLIIDTECHPLGEYRQDLGYFPHLRRSKEAMDERRRLRGNQMPDLNWGEDVGDACVHDMDLGGVDLAWCSRHDLRDSAMGYPVSTNGQMFELCSKHPDRLLFTANLGQVVRRGMNDSLWELDYWVKEGGCRIVKYYCPDDTYLNDERLWPFYQRCQDYEIIVCIHTGASATIPQASKFGHPLLLDDVCAAFPDLRIVAYHLGWPWYREMIQLMQKYQNLYSSISGKPESVMRKAPWTAHQFIGEAMAEGVGEKIMWGSEWFSRQYAPAVKAMQDLKGMPEEFARGFGLPPITDEIKRSILGGAAAKLLGISPVKKRPLAATA